MTPYHTASLPEDVAVANVAAKPTISSGASHPNRIPAPMITPTTASNATHDQSYAVTAPSPAATATAGARYSIRRVPPILLPSTPNRRPTIIAEAPSFPASASINPTGSTTTTSTAPRI